MRLNDPAMKIKRRKIKNTKLHIPTLAQFAAIVAQIRKGSTSSKPTDKGNAAELAANQQKANAGADLIEFLTYSGCRIGEATAARWQDIDFETNKLFVLPPGAQRSDGSARFVQRSGNGRGGVNMRTIAPARRRSVKKQSALNGLEARYLTLYVAFRPQEASVSAPGPMAGFADAVDIIKIIFRIFINSLNDLRLLPRRLKVRYRFRRRAAAWRICEVERLDRIRNPGKYRGV